MEFDWDEHNIRHLARHKVTPAEFEEAMRNPRILMGVDDEESEERWYALGATNALRVLVLIFHLSRQEGPACDRAPGGLKKGDKNTSNPWVKPMARKLVIPVFSSEDEDAAWHNKHMREIQDEFSRQLKAGTAIVVREKRLPLANSSRLSQVRIRLPKSDVLTAKQQAAERGVAYETYIRALLHDSLARNAGRK